MKRSSRAETATETLQILSQGGYSLSKTRRITIAEDLKFARKNSVLYTSEAGDQAIQKCDEMLSGMSHVTTKFKVVNLTTLAATKQCLTQGTKEVLALNFASAKHPGGGFTTGSQSQEESLARATGLYACISPHEIMYTTNKQFGSCLYTDCMIYSPQVPVFRDDDDQLIAEPYLVSFISAPAVNTGVVAFKEPQNVPQIEEVMLRRIHKILAIAVIHHHKNLVLGAWGCGVFKNEPQQVANWFYRHLVTGKFKNVFTQVMFAIFDSGKNKHINIFQEIFV